jgi:hypothetical protein
MSTLRAPRRTTLFGALDAGLIVFLLGLASVSGMAQSAPPRSVTLQDLTVPKDRLPDGCGLKVVEPGWQSVSVTPAQNSQGVHAIGPITPWMQPQGVTVNPWTGTNRPILVELRRSIDGPHEFPVLDAPPLTPGEASSMWAQFANGVQEGYAATYAQTGGRDLGVWAVKFAQTPERHLDFPGDKHSSPATTVLTMGLIRAALFGDGGACSLAIETYLKSPGK